jgi:hypothetical protein
MSCQPSTKNTSSAAFVIWRADGMCEFGKMFRSNHGSYDVSDVSDVSFVAYKCERGDSNLARASRDDKPSRARAMTTQACDA